jgi:FkbM family methyltransferase
MKPCKVRYSSKATEVLKRLVQSVFTKLGYQIVRIDIARKTGHAEGLDPFFALLKRSGFAPRHIVDVGANKGIWTREAIKYFPGAHYTLVEPQGYLKVHIQDLIKRGFKITWIPAGIGDQPGELPFYLSHRDDSSTFLVPEAARDSNIVSVPIMTLNQVVASTSLSIPEMVKIDAEGFDLKVLSGASTLFGKTDIFLVEAVVRENNGFENSLSKVIECMSSAGYGPLDITNLNRSPKHGIVWLCELAFLRNGSGLLDGVTSYE